MLDEASSVESRNQDTVASVGESQELQHFALNPERMDADWEQHVTSQKVDQLATQLKEMQAWNTIWSQATAGGPAQMQLLVDPPRCFVIFSVWMK